MYRAILYGFFEFVGRRHGQFYDNSDQHVGAFPFGLKLVAHPSFPICLKPLGRYNYPLSPLSFLSLLLSPFSILPPRPSSPSTFLLPSPLPPPSRPTLHSRGSLDTQFSFKYTVTPKDILVFIRAGMITRSDFHDEDIQDRAKVDSLGVVFTVYRACNMVTRAAYSLSISPLEVGTVAYFACGMFLHGF